MLDVIKTQQMQQIQYLAKISGKLLFLLQPNSTAWVRLLVFLCRAQPVAECFASISRACLSVTIVLRELGSVGRAQVSYVCVIR